MSVVMGYLVVGLLSVAAVLLLAMNVIATVSVRRTRQLGRGQKVAQVAFVWCLPFLGAMLVTRLLAESDPRVVYRQRVPNDTINTYVLQLLTVQARMSLHATRDAIEHSIIDGLSSLSEDSSAGHSHGGGGEGD